MRFANATMRVTAVMLVLLAACSDPAPAGTPNGGPPLPVVVRSDAASAAECPYGGTAVSSGLDNNGDGKLEDTEVTNRSVVCSAAPMQGPPVVVVRLVAEPPGGHCAAGGTAVLSGPDQNRNGVLDDSEIAHIDYACGLVLLRRLAAEPPGANCSIGGVAFLAGRDRDGDGVLEDAEVETRSFECSDVVARDVTIASDADVAALADVRIITGTVLADFAFRLQGISLPKLEHVGGGLRVLSSGGLPTMQIALPRLQEVDGVFELRNSLVDGVDCPLLQRVGSLSVTGTDLSDLSGFPALTTVDGDLELEFNHQLVSAALPPISVGGDITIEDNEKLASLTWQLVGRVGGISMFSSTAATSIDISVARRGGEPSQIGPITLFGADALTHFAVSADRVAALAVNFDAQITDIAIDVGSFDGDVTVFGIAGPFHLGLTPAGADHIAIGGRLLVSSPLQRIDVAAPLTVGDLCVFDGTRLTRFDPGSSLTVRGGVRFSANPHLTSVAPLTLLPGASLQVIDNAVLPSIDFLTLHDHQIGGMLISDNPVLADAPSLAGVAEVHGEVDVERNPALIGLFDASLRRIEGPVFLEDNASLRELRYPLLEHVFSDFIVQRNAVLQTIEVPALTEAADELFIDNNPLLQHIAFDALTHADVFEVGNNPHLPACEVLAIFTHVTGFARGQSGNDNTASCGP